GNQVWRLVRIPLAGSAAWRRTTTGSPSLAAVDQIEIHQDTWDSGFTVYYDSLKFQPASVALSNFQVSNVPSFNIVGAVGMYYLVQHSHDLDWWFDLTNVLGV